MPPPGRAVAAAARRPVGGARRGRPPPAARPSAAHHRPGSAAPSRRGRAGWCRWARRPRSTWAIASTPVVAAVSISAASSTAYPVGTDSVSNSDRRTAHSPASGWCRPARSGKKRDQRAGDQLGDPAAVVGPPSPARPLVEALHQRHLRRGEQRAEQPGHEVGVPVEQVGVHEDQHVAAGHEQRLPHRLALARDGAEVGPDLRRAVHDRAGVGGDRVGRVGGVGVDHHDLVEQRTVSTSASPDPGDHVADGGGLVAGGHDQAHRVSPLAATRSSRVQSSQW